MNRMKKILAGVGAAVLASCGLFGQAAPRPVFDVASIKPSAPDDKGGWVHFLPGGRFEVTNAQLIFVIQQLYGVKDYQIVDAPKWIVDWNTARFNIEAEAEGVTSQDQLRLMARNLLEDRFQLKLHRETRDLPVYLLTQGKNGVKTTATPDNGRPIRTGFIEPVEPGWLQGADITMKSFISSLSRYTDRPVLDGTNYTQKFTFKLQWAEEERPGRGASGDDAQPDMARPSLFTAVQEQMGLKLVPQKAPVEVLVIDRIDRPSEN
jgi:uncharacterized protein (TIGR03435 family)